MITQPTDRDIQLIRHMRTRQGNEAPRDSLALSADWLHFKLGIPDDNCGEFKEKWHYVQNVAGGHWNVLWPDGSTTIFMECDQPGTHQRIAAWRAHI